MKRGSVAASFGSLLALALLATLPKVTASAAPKSMQRLSDGIDVLELRTPNYELAFIAAGKFVMGSTGPEIQTAFLDCRSEPLGSRCQPDSFGDEQPTREITLSSFQLQVHEVTVAEYSRCVAARRCRPAPYYRGAQRFRQDSRYPASLVSWEDSRDYCAFWGGRLPTEAEFERAARGHDGRVYPWGDLYNDHVSNHGRFASNSSDDIDGYPELAPVGSFPDGASAEGVLDLAGNVAEWVWDRYAPEYDIRDTTDPFGPSTSAASNLRVVRGGGFDSAAYQLRSAARDDALPATRRPSLGFRCARSTANR